MISLDWKYWDFINDNMLSIHNVLLLVVFVILMWVIASLLLFRSSDIPGPTGYAIVGNLLEFTQSKNILKTYMKWRKIYGPIVGFKPIGVFGTKRIMLTDAEAIRQVLVASPTKYDRHAVGAALFPAMAKSVLLERGKKHAQQRKMLNPIFKVSNLKGMVDVFQRKATLLVKVWSDVIANNTDDNSKEFAMLVQKDFARLTLDVVGECAFGYHFNSITDGNNFVSSAFNRLFTGAGFTQRLFKMIPIIRNIPTKARRTEQEMNKITSEITLQVIRQKREVQETKECDEDYSKAADLLDLLIKAFDEDSGHRMDEEELRAQTFAFMIAGYETSSTALTWTSYLLALHPEIQERLRREIQEKLQGDNLDWDTFESMEYLTAVVKESLRIRTPIPIFRREALKEDVILGYEIPPGTVIEIATYVLHRCPEYWKDPETFDPERFLTADNDENRIHRFAFLPFGGGHRTCIGYRFALMEIKVVLAILLQNFSFSIIPGRSFDEEVRVSYKPKPPLELLVRKL